MADGALAIRVIGWSRAAFAAELDQRGDFIDRPSGYRSAAPWRRILGVASQRSTMRCVDSPTLVLRTVLEPHSTSFERWYDRSRATPVSVDWCITDFAIALGTKRRTVWIHPPQAQDAWQRFEPLIANNPALLPSTTANPHHAAALALEAPAGLRAGEALPLQRRAGRRKKLGNAGAAVGPQRAAAQDQTSGLPVTGCWCGLVAPQCIGRAPWSKF